MRRSLRQSFQRLRYAGGRPGRKIRAAQFMELRKDPVGFRKRLNFANVRFKFRAEQSPQRNAVGQRAEIRSRATTP